MFSESLAAHLAILVSWAVLAALFCGLGLLVRRAWARREVDAAALLQTFWLGFALTIMFLQVWHLRQPIGAKAGLILAGLGVLGLGVNARALWSWLRQRPRWGWLLLSLVALGWLANRATGPCDSVDSGTYHLAAVRWARTYPIVPGLANLNDRLGFNNAGFLYVAVLEASPWRQRATHLANGLLLVALLAQVLRAAARIGCAQTQRWETVADLFWLPYLIKVSIGSDVSSLTTDVGVAALCMVLAARLCRMVLEDEGVWTFDVFWITTLSAAAVCLKASAVGFALPAAVIALVLGWRRGRAGMVAAVVAPLLLLAPWLGRSVILSGYPLFPLTLAPAHVDWRVPMETCRSAAEIIVAWSHQNAFTMTVRWLGGWNWVVPWLYSLVVRAPVTVLLPAGLAVVALGMLGRRGKKAWWLLAPSACGLVLWMVQAPMPRFGTFLFWTAAGVAWELVFYTRYAQAPRAVWVRGRNLILLLGLAPLAYEMALTAIHKHQDALGLAEYALWMPPGPDHGLYPTPTTALTQRKTRWGLVLNVSAEENGIPWDAPLPTTKYLNPNLRLRRTDDLAAGFATVQPPELALEPGAADELVARVKHGDVVYLYYGSEAARMAYGALLEQPGRYGDIRVRVRSVDGWAVLSDDLDTLKGRRVWVVFAGWNTPEEKVMFVEEWLERRSITGHATAHYGDDAVDAYLYELSSTLPRITRW